MSRKRTYDIDALLDACTYVGRNSENPPEICSAALKCLAILADARTRAYRNATLRAESSAKKTQNDTVKTQKDLEKYRARELKTLISKYQPDLEAQKAAGNTRLVEMMAEWNAELETLTRRGVTA